MSVSDTAKEVYRDYETDGLPSSGVHEVEKSAVRALFEQIATELASIADIADGIVFRGDWDSGTTYAGGNSVSYDGGSYVSRVDANLNNQPDTSPTQWQLLSAKGAAGSASSSSTVAWSGVISPTQITSTPQNNYNPTDLNIATVLRLSSDAAGYVITGLAGGATGRIIKFRNVGSFDIRLSALAATGSTSSSSFNRFAFPDDVILRPGGADIEMQYDVTTTRWRLSAASLQEGKAEPETVVASASTTDIGATNTRRVAVSGTATIASFGARAKQERVVRFTGAATLTNSAALALLGGADRTVTAGDVGIYASDASGNWQELSFTGYNTLADVSEAIAQVAELTATVDALPVLPDADTIDPDGAASVTRSTLGRELDRTSGTGEFFAAGEGEAPLAYFDDADSGKLKAIGGPYLSLTTLLQASLANTIKRSTGSVLQRVQGGWRAPFTFLGNVHGGRAGQDAIVPDNGSTLYVVPFMGQSNQGGAAGDLLRINHPFPDRLVMPATNNPPDIRLFLNQLASEALVSSNVSGFTPMVGARSYPGTVDDAGTSQSEIAMSTFARLIGEACGNWTTPLCAYVAWKGGTDVAAMAPAGGSNVNENTRAAGAAIVREAAKLGYKVNFLAICIDQGENDTTNATLADQWVTIVADINTYFKGLTGQVNDIVPFINQTSSFSTSTGEKSKVIRYRTDQKIIPVAPRYMIGASAWNDADYLHMDNVGHFRLGEAVGYALFKHFCQGGYAPLYVVSATAPTGGGSTVTVNLSEAPAIDTTLVESITQNGIYVKTNSGGATDIAVNSIGVVGSTLVLTLASPISPGTFAAPIVTIGTYPGQNTPRDAAGIARTNVRSAAQLGRSQLDGRAIHKWLLHDTVTITYI